jgi:hypothetical protein
MKMREQSDDDVSATQEEDLSGGKREIEWS